MTTEISTDQSIFLEAVEYVPQDRWKAFIKERCADDVELHNRVERLLRAHCELGAFQDQQPIAARAASVGKPLIEVPGTIIGPYKLLEQIGEGGMGAVYMAQQAEPVRRKVALKIIKPGMATRQVIARFEAELRALAMMEHPHIAHVYDAGVTESGLPYFVMELVRGMPITRYCDQRQLDSRQRLELFATVCRAVQHAHQKGIIHRDLKPTNVLVEQHDVTPVPKIIDFGVAKAINRELIDKTLITNFAQMIGTPLYMSPEQAELSGLDVDTRSDIYSLGVLLYELLTGTTPFDKVRLHAEPYHELCRIIREEEPPRPSARLSTLAAYLATTVTDCRRTDSRRLVQTVRGDLDWIVMKCLEKDRNRRYESANALAVDIQRHLDQEPIQARPPRLFAGIRKWSRRHRVLLAATLATLLVSGLMSTGIIGWFARDRVARQSAAEATANGVLEEATRLVEQEKWPEALSEVRRAEDVLAGSGVRGALTARAHDLRDDIEMVLHLEEIRTGLDTEQLLDGKTRFDPQTDRKNAEAFRDYGIDIESLPPIIAAERLARRGIRGELATALDTWAQWRRTFIPNDDEWKRLVEIARLADPDPWRNRIRDAIGTNQKDQRTALAELAASIDAESAPPQTILLFASVLYESEAHAHAVAPLLAARKRHPDNFRINLQLGDHYYSMSPDPNQAIRYYTAAQALRPESTVAHNRLGTALVRNGSDDEAIINFQEAIRLRPANAPPYFNLGMIFRNRGLAAKAVIYFEQAYQLTKDNLNKDTLGPCYVLAELLAVSRDDKVRDGNRAVELAKKACETTKYENAEMIMILAEAYAEANHFESAVKWSNKAIELTNNDEHREVFTKCLEAFQAGRPWRAERW